MLQRIWRDNRIVDAAVTQSLSASPLFVASTGILIIGGLLAAPPCMPCSASPGA
jgi:uncharacterized membrane protein